MSLAQKIGTLFGLLAAIVVTDTILLYHFFDRTAHYGPFIDLASRQTFLVDRMALLLRLSEKESVVVRPELVESVDEFDRLLKSLEQRGEFSGGSLTRTPKHVVEPLTRERQLWDELRPLLLAILEAEPDGNQGGASLASRRRAEALIPELSASSIEVVRALQGWRVEQQNGILYVGAASAVFAGLVLLGALAFAWKGFVKPVERILSEALRIREEHLPEPSGGDLADVSTLVSEISTDVERLRFEREEVEEELRQVEADYQAIFDNAVAGIYQFDRGGRLLLANAAMAQLLGYASRSEIVHAITNVYHGLFADPDHRDALMAAAVASEPLVRETRLRRKDGSLIWVCESVRFASGVDRSDYFDSIIIDITPRKKAEESLRELSNLLLRSQEEERRRIARELHDSTGQMLAALEMNLDRLDEGENQLPGETQRILSSCKALVADCSRQVRSMSYLLHPPMLEELGLVYALREFAEGFSKRSGIEAQLHLPSDLPRVPQDVELALFRITQETLTNIHRHSESPIAIVSLRAVSNEIRLSVQDRGKGIPPDRLGTGEDALAQMGVGIRGMAERLKQLGGRLDIQSGPQGTTVEATLPLEETVAAPG